MIIPNFSSLYHYTYDVISIQEYSYTDGLATITATMCGKKQFFFEYISWQVEVYEM